MVTIDPRVLSDNTTERRRLEACAGPMESADRDLGNGWTVTVALAHLAFWDRLATLTLQRWERGDITSDEAEPDLLNDALIEEWRALSPRQAADLAVAAARRVDAAVEALDARTVAAILARGEEWLIRRDVHRREHLDQIEGVTRG